MTLLRHFIKGTESILCTKRSFVLGVNSYNAENYFGSKIEVPSPPKRPLTAYMIFVKENRKELIKENPSLSSPEQIKILAKKWGHLTESMKEPYELSSRQSIQVYGEEHKKFYDSLTEEQRIELAKAKSKRLESRRILRIKKELRASGVPKHPNSAYIHFMQAEAKKKPEINHPTEFLKKVGEMWKSLPDDSKRVYENQAQEEKICFADEMQKWRERMISEGKEKLVKAYDDLKRKGKLADSEEASAGKKKATAKSAKDAPNASRK